MCVLFFVRVCRCLSLCRVSFVCNYAMHVDDSDTASIPHALLLRPGLLSSASTTAPTSRRHRRHWQHSGNTHTTHAARDSPFSEPKTYTPPPYHTRAQPRTCTRTHIRHANDCSASMHPCPHLVLTPPLPGLIWKLLHQAWLPTATTALIGESQGLYQTCTTPPNHAQTHKQAHIHSCTCTHARTQTHTRTHTTHLHRHHTTRCSSIPYNNGSDNGVNRVTR